MTIARKKHWNYAPRRPRHTALINPTVEAFVDRKSHETPRRMPVILVDFSRQGAQVIAPLPVAEGETVSLCLQGGPLPSALSFPCRVCWVRTGLPQPGWHMGCEFSAQVTWETLGGLFLDGVLDTQQGAGELDSAT